MNDSLQNVLTCFQIKLQVPVVDTCMCNKVHVQPFCSAYGV